jgi:aspartate aminotransferase
MGDLSYFGENIIGSEIIKIAQKLKEISKTRKIYNYTIGDFDSEVHSIPKQLEELIGSYYLMKKTNYPLGKGEVSLRDEISLYLKREHGIDFSPEEVLIGAGARPLIYLLYKTILDPNDKVVIPVPSWNNNHYSTLHNTNACYIETKPENDFFPTFEDIEREISDARLICLCSPQNPTGKVMSPDLLKKICQLVVDENKRRGDGRKVYLFFDQIYSELSQVGFFGPTQLVPECKKYVIHIDGISKSLCATGVRVGWMFADEHVIKKATEIFSHIGAWAPKPEQLAVAQYLKTYVGYQSFLTKKKQQFGDVFDKFTEFLSYLKLQNFSIDYLNPDGAIYISIYLQKSLEFDTTERFLDFIIDNYGIGLVPFEYFGSKENKGWFRLSIGTLDIQDIDDHFYNFESMIRFLESL